MDVDRTGRFTRYGLARRRTHGGLLRPTKTKVGGYAAIDAMVALMIISATLAFGFQLTQQARQASGLAWEARQAATLLRYILETSPKAYGPQAGAVDAFTWQVQTDPMGTQTLVQVCHLSATVQAQASGRVYQAATLETCPVAA